MYLESTDEINHISKIMFGVLSIFWKIINAKNISAKFLCCLETHVDSIAWYCLENTISKCYLLNFQSNTYSAAPG